MKALRSDRAVYPDTVSSPVLKPPTSTTFATSAEIDAEATGGFLGVHHPSGNGEPPECLVGRPQLARRRALLSQRVGDVCPQQSSARDLIMRLARTERRDRTVEAGGGIRQ